MDLKKRSWAKSITWRVIGVLILGVISYVFTRSWKETTAITALFHGLRLILYYVHERAWERIAWGRFRHPLSHLSMRDGLTPEDYRMIERLLAEQDYLARPPEYEI